MILYVHNKIFYIPNGLPFYANFYEKLVLCEA